MRKVKCTQSYHYLDEVGWLFFERPSTEVQQIQVQKNKKLITWEAMQSLKKGTIKTK